MIKEVKIDGQVLTCPNGCGYANLHQKQIVSMFRDKEDGPGSRVAANYCGTSVAQVASGEIPGRRDALFIEFECEQCGGLPSLRIMQRKGETLISWVDDYFEGA